jgi:hypothetical protein
MLAFQHPHLRRLQVVGEQSIRLIPKPSANIQAPTSKSSDTALAVAPIPVMWPHPKQAFFWVAKCAAPADALRKMRKSKYIFAYPKAG